MSHPIERFFCREQTYRRPEDAYRSFYKFVCKNELYGRLEIAGYWRERPFYERGPCKFTFGYQFRRGYPSFNATRSEARKQWNSDFLDAKRRLADQRSEEEQRAWEANYYGKNRLRAITPATMHFFRAMSDLSKLKNVQTTR